MGLTPRSLAHERAVEQPAPGTEESWWRKALLTIGGFYSRESRLIRGAKVLYHDIVEQATNKDFYKGVYCISYKPLLLRCQTQSLQKIQKTLP
jgi:hypothetical protein